MAEQNRLRSAPHYLRAELIQRYRSELAVDEGDLMTFIDQRTAYAEEAERRQLLPWDSASDRRVGHVHEENTQIDDPVPAEALVRTARSKEDERGEEKTCRDSVLADDWSDCWRT
jgi:hypothetical protein